MTCKRVSVCRCQDDAHAHLCDRPKHEEHRDSEGDMHVYAQLEARVVVRDPMLDVCERLVLLPGGLTRTGRRAKGC
jgi:hypothetical protein